MFEEKQETGTNQTYPTLKTCPMKTHPMNTQGTLEIQKQEKQKLDSGNML